MSKPVVAVGPAKNADGAERYKAYRIRRKAEAGRKLTDDEKAYLADYDEQHKGRSATATERITHIEERHAAEAEGDHSLGELAGLATAEGLRADTLMRIATKALVTCVDMHMRMANHLLERTSKIEESHVAMLDAVRDSHVARADAEGQALLLEQMLEQMREGGSGEDGQMIALLMRLMESRGGGRAARKGKKKATVPSGGG